MNSKNEVSFQKFDENLTIISIFFVTFDNNKQVYYYLVCYVARYSVK
jgi:hypothetical protein